MIVVSCGKAKRAEASPAGYLYVGSFARGALDWARSVAPTESIYVLSALYGLVPHGVVIEPYEMTLGAPGAITADAVRDQARTLGVADEVPIVVAGAAYRKLARQVWGTIETPFSPERGFRSMGAMLQGFARHRGEMP